MSPLPISALVPTLNAAASLPATLAALRGAVAEIIIADGGSTDGTPDIARACGSVGHITALRRMRVGPFHEKDAVALDKIAVSGDTPPPSPALLLPVTTALADIPALALTEAEAARLSFGQHIPLVDFMGRVPRVANPDGGLARAMVGGRLMGLARLEEGLLKPERWLGQGDS